MIKTETVHSVSMTARLTRFCAVNDEFTRCRCNMFYTGRNRNRSDITQRALEKFIERKGYANIPVVAQLTRDGNGHYTVGGHGGNMKCVPFGVIPEDCNPGTETITEKDGTKRNYFSVDLILWTHRYPIMEAAYSDEIYFSQSMEAVFNDTAKDGDYTVVNDFTLSAVCLLNKSGSGGVEPCFESAAVKSFSVQDESFRKDMETMLEKLDNIKPEIPENTVSFALGPDKIAEKLTELEEKITALENELEAYRKKKSFSYETTSAASAVKRVPSRAEERYGDLISRFWGN